MAGAPRPGAQRPGTQRRAPQRHRGGPEPRILLVGALVVATLVGGWWFLLRDDSVQSPEFVKAERSYVEAARAIPPLADQIQLHSKLKKFLGAVAQSRSEMDSAVGTFAGLATTEDGEAAQVARAASETGRRGLTEFDRYTNAIAVSADLNDAEAALKDLEATIAELGRHARDWNNLG